MSTPNSPSSSSNYGILPPPPPDDDNDIPPAPPGYEPIQQQQPSIPSPYDSILDSMRIGSEFFLYTNNPAGGSAGTITTNRIFLFLRDSNTNQTDYGRFGTLCWTINGIESESNRIPLHTIIDIRLNKSTILMKNDSLKQLNSNLTISITAIIQLSTSQQPTIIELNLSAFNSNVRETFYSGIIYKFESGGNLFNNLNGNNISPVSSNSSTTSTSIDPNSPIELRRLLQSGSHFKKFDIDPISNKIYSNEILLFTEGIGRSGSLYWIDLNSPISRNNSINNNNIPYDNRLSLERITDFMLKKKSPPLKQSTAMEECCFALVTANYTLNLESPSKDLAKNWKEGLIIMLTTAGKQVFQSAPVSVPAVPGLQRDPSIPPPPPQSNPPPQLLSQQQQSQSASVTAASALLNKPIDSSDPLFALKEGQIFTLYYANAKGQQEVAKVNIFFVELIGSESPGALYWCSSGGKKMLEGQRLLLNSLKQMVAGREQISFKSATAAQLVPNEHCFSVVGKSLVLNLESPSASIRELWMKGLHSVMMKYQQIVAEKKKANQAAAAAAAVQAIANSVDLPVSGSGSGSSSSAILPPPPPILDENIRILKEGQQFTMYSTAVNSATIGEFECKSIFLFFVESDGPGTLYYTDPLSPNKRELILNNKFLLSSITRMVAGKETAPFQSILASKVPIDRCLSVIGKQSTLNLEAPSFDIRELWMKSLHQIMLKYGKKAHPSQPTTAVAAAAATSPTNNNNNNNSVQSPTNANSSVSSSPNLNVSPVPYINPLSEPEAQYLAAGHNFKLFYQTKTGDYSSTEITIYFEPLTGGEYPGALQWQSSSINTRNRIEGQRMLLNKIQQMAGGKDTTVLKSNAAANSPRERCLYLNTSTVSLNLEAVSAESKNIWMKNLHQLMIKLGRQTIDETKKAAAAAAAASQQQLPNGNNSVIASSAANRPPAAVPSMDAKTALTIVQTGQIFTMYTINERQEGIAQSYYFFFQTSSGSEIPGILYWCDVAINGGTQHQVLIPKQRFVLNTIKQMRAGKETPPFKTPIAAKAKLNNCLSLFSNHLTLNLEAPSQDIRDNWMKSLHTVLVRYGMKAVEDQESANLSNNSNNPANSPAIGSSRSLEGQSLNPSMSRTINFMDPTEFFSIQAKIGEGSYGAVYKAIDHRDGRSVAIKVIPFTGKDSLKLRKEIRVLKRCNCPFIVAYKGAFHKNDNVWIVMEYMAAGSLSDIMQICKRTLSEQQVASVMRMSLAGLAYLHGENLIHRDIKGGNILTDSQGVCKLADFGVSGNLDKTLGKHRTVIGTPHWMAPEVLMSDDYNELADIWSLGITAYELAIGEPPHAKLHSMRAALKIPMSPPPTLPDPTHWTQDFHSFLAACLVKDFNIRPSAAQLLTHPFITKAPSHQVLMDIVVKSVQHIESKAIVDVTTADVINKPPVLSKQKSTDGDDDPDSSNGSDSANNGDGAGFDGEI